MPTSTPDPLVLIRDSLVDARRQRDEQTAALNRLADSMTTHEIGSVTRHVEMMGALTAQGAALKAIEDGKSWPRRVVEKIATEAWTAFKMPIAGLVTVVCAYYGWAYFKIPTTPSPVQIAQPVVTTPDPAPTMGASTVPVSAVATPTP